MQPLTDKEIRQALVSSLEKRKRPPEAILQEVHVCNGNAIVDVVAVYKSLHCYEIKGETDSVHRLQRQSQYYDQAAPIISLVTTTNHLRRAKDILPGHWGIIVAKLSKAGKIQLRYERGASKNPAYKPEIALLSLWRSEMINLPNLVELSLEKMNRQKIAEFFASTTSVNIVNQTVGQILSARERRPVIQDSALPCTLCENKSSASKLSTA